MGHNVDKYIRSIGESAQAIFKVMAGTTTRRVYLCFSRDAVLRTDNYKKLWNILRIDMTCTNEYYFEWYMDKDFKNIIDDGTGPITYLESLTTGWRYIYE